VWGAIAALAVLLINLRFLDDEYLFFVLLNLLGAYGFVYALQGLAVFLHFLAARRIVGLMRLILYLLILLFLHFSAVFFVLLGIVDNWADFRKIEAGSMPAGPAPPPLSDSSPP
jgi:uncharacterized protein YybS (DUF2232 family)